MMVILNLSFSSYKEEERRKKLEGGLGGFGGGGRGEREKWVGRGGGTSEVVNEEESGILRFFEKNYFFKIFLHVFYFTRLKTHTNTHF